jgi:molecular chaperone GrpE (heat shock protein)
VGGWEAISSGANTLICAPTGSGKTLASFLWGIDKLSREKDRGEGVRLVYVSPLKALSYDIERNLRAPLRGIGADISVGLRTGDTPQKERRAMQKDPPDILITTPESLYLMLSSAVREIFFSTEAVIVDEIHAVAQSKRGSHLALSLERLEHLVKTGADRAAGPVGAGDPPPLPVAKASSGAVPPTPPPAGDASDQIEQDFDALLADTQRERDEYLDLAKRSKADFENYRKRMASEVQAAAGRGKAEVIREVVPVLDDLERAIQAAGLDPEGDSEDGLSHGVLLVFRSLRDSLSRNGVEAVDPKGEKFDPMEHEALSMQPAEGVEPGTVVEVMQKGYRLGEQLIRPARVVVSE